MTSTLDPELTGEALKAVEGLARDGFDAPSLCEHQGGDGVSVSATKRDYLRTLLPRAPKPHP